MKKIILICSTLLCCLSFGQSKKEIYKKFENSNVRKALNIKKTDFSKFYNYAKSENLNLNKILIFNSIKDKKSMERIKDIYFVNPQKCSDCNTIIFRNSINDTIEFVGF